MFHIHLLKRVTTLSTYLEPCTNSSRRTRRHPCRLAGQLTGRPAASSTTTTAKPRHQHIIVLPSNSHHKLTPSRLLHLRHSLHTVGLPRLRTTTPLSPTSDILLSNTFQPNITTTTSTHEKENGTSRGIDQGLNIQYRDVRRGFLSRQDWEAVLCIIPAQMKVSGRSRRMS